MARRLVFSAVLGVAVVPGLPQAGVYECVIDGRPQLVSGADDAAPPEGCRSVEGAGVPQAQAGYADLARRLEAQERAIERLSSQVRALAARLRRPALEAPEPSLAPRTPLTDSVQRRRDLGQDIERKLDMLNTERRDRVSP